MSLKTYSLLIVIVLLFTNCSGNPSDVVNSEPGGDSLKIDFNLIINNSTNARPGGFVTISAKVDKITQDSLTGVNIWWETMNEGIKLERQSPNTVAAFIPKSFTGKNLTVNAELKMVNDNVLRNKNSRSITVEISNDPIPVELIQGYITENKVLDEKKVYRLTKNISLENGAVLLT